MPMGLLPAAPLPPPGFGHVVLWISVEPTRLYMQVHADDDGADGVAVDAADDDDVDCDGVADVYDNDVVADG